VAGEPGMMNALFGRRCFMAYTAHPNGEVWWVANPACPTEPTPAELAFNTYERLRRVRVERVVEQGKRTGGWKALNLVARVPRDLIMSLAMKRMARTGNDPSQWIYDHHIDWDEPVRSSS
jgi:FAD-dependent urate hydroxylase